MPDRLPAAPSRKGAEGVRRVFVRGVGADAVPGGEAEHRAGDPRRDGHPRHEVRLDPEGIGADPRFVPKGVGVEIRPEFAVYPDEEIAVESPHQSVRRPVGR